MDVIFRSRWGLIVLVAGVAGLGAPVLAEPAAGPATPQASEKANEAQPATAPEAPEVEAMRQWFGELDDADSSVRELARVKLMGMRRRDLPAFQKLIQDSRPLMPAQAAVLRQIVTHVYLAGEEYTTTGTEGFLGVRMQETSVRIPAGDTPDRFSPSVGVVIVERMPGFVGARMLLDGDVVLGVAERPEVRSMGVNDFQMVVRQITPGTTVHFQVMRQGQVMRVPVTLDPRPFDPEAFILQDLIYRRQQKADDYWNRSFGPLVKESVG